MDEPEVSGRRAADIEVGDPPSGEVEADAEVDAARERARAALFGAGRVGHGIGRFTLLGPVGQGGMGTVYAAYDPQLDRRIAIKLLSIEPDVPEPARARRRMLAEARAMAKVSHPNVVTVHEVGVHEQGRASSVFVAMEFVEGRTLREWIRHERPTWRRIVEVYAAAGRGLAAVHDAGLVHRDFKPDNAMLGRDGRVRVMDFGLVLVDDLPTDRGGTSSALDPASRRLTQTGALLGTPAYMAPEQLAGGVADARSDQYSFCVALHEALWGRRPFEADDLAQLVSRVLEHDEPPAPPRAGVPGRVRDAVRRGLAREPEERWPSMRALVDAITPRKSGRRIGAGLVGGAAVVLAIAWPEARQEGPAPCGGGEAAFEEAWNDDARSAIRAAFERVDTAHGGGAAERVVGRLDDYAGRWVAQHREACVATTVRREQSEDRLDLRMRCLDDRRARVGALVDVLREPSEAVVERAVHAIDALTVPERCADSAYLDASVEPPADPEIARRVAELRERIDRADALAETGHGLEAAELLDVVREEAEAVEYPPLHVEALYAAAHVGLGVRQDFRAEIDRLIEAYFRAREVGLPLVATSSAVEIAIMLATGGDRVEEAAHWLRLARAEARAHGLTDFDAKLLLAESSLAEREGRYGRAIELQLENLERQRSRCGDECELLGAIYESLSLLYAQTRDYDRSLEYARAAVDLETGRHGRNSPHTALPLVRLGEALGELGRHREAVGVLRRAVALRRSTLDPDHVNTITAHAALGSVLMDDGRPEEAIAVLQRALELARARDVIPGKLNVLNRLGSVYVDVGRFEDARRAYQEALDMMQRAHPEGHSVNDVLLSNLAFVAAEEGDHETALETFERALQSYRAHADEPGLGTSPFLANIGMELTALGRFDEAVVPLREASELLAAQTVNPMIVTMELRLADALRRSDPQAARRSLDALGARCELAGAQQAAAAGCDEVAKRRDEWEL